MMRKALVRVVVLVVLAATVVGGGWAWTRRPWRVVATVNGVTLTARELDLRAESFGGDRREAVRTWIAKQVLLDEAVQRRVSVAGGDECMATNVFAARLTCRGKTWESFFTGGPFPENEQRQDFQDGLLVHALVKDALRTESFADFYRALRAKADVRCPEFQELEHLDTGAPLYALLWGWRPARVAAVAAGQVLTSAELDLRVQNARDDWRRRGQPLPNERMLRRHEVEFWIFKAVMRAEAERQGFKVTNDDRNEAMGKTSQKSRRLESHYLTVGQFFKEGILPEQLKWRGDFDAEILIGKFIKREVQDKIDVSPREITARMAELRKRAADAAARGEKTTIRSDRKTAENLLRHERFVKGVHALFRTLFGSARVWSSEFPEMGQVDQIRDPIWCLYESARIRYPELPNVGQVDGIPQPSFLGGGVK